MEYHSSNPKNQKNGIWFIIDKTMTKFIIGFNALNNRMALVRIQSRPLNITIIQVYTLIAEAEEVETEDFYSQLKDLLNRFHR